MRYVTKRVEEWVRERLQWENWEALLERTIAFAADEIRRRRWRGSRSGVLPEGQDANGLASEIVAWVLEGKCRLALGWTRHRLEKELRRLVSNEVRRLHALAEASEMRSEWNVLPAGEEGKRRSVFRGLAGNLRDGAEEVVREEAEQKLEAIEGRIAKLLDGDSVAKGIFKCVCDGVVRRSEIASRLGIEAAAVSAGRKRLNRKLDELVRKGAISEKAFVEELKRL